MLNKSNTVQSDKVFNSIEETSSSEEKNTVVKQFLAQQLQMEFDCSENQSYSSLLFLFTLWMKIHGNKLSIEGCNFGDFKIKIDKSIGRDQLVYFSKLFEELTLFRINFLDYDIPGQWICNFTV